MGSRNMKNILVWLGQFFSCLALFGSFYVIYILAWAIYPEGF